MANKKNKATRPTVQVRREFQKNLTILKHKGLVSRKKDIRKQKITKHYKAKIKAFKDVIEGTATSVKVSKSIYKEYKDRGGYRTTFGRVIVPTEPGTISEAKRGQYVERTSFVGNAVVEEILLPVDAGNIHEFIEQVRRDPERYDKLKANKQRFAFKFFGHNSFATFSDIELLADYLEHYEAVINAHSNDEASQTIWQNFVLYKVSNLDAWKHATAPKERRRKLRHRGQQDDRGNYRTIKMTPAERYSKEAKQKKEYRQKKKENMSSEQRETNRIKERDRKRQQRSRVASPKFSFD